MEMVEALALLRGKDGNEGILWRGEEVAKLIEKQAARIVELEDLTADRFAKIVGLESNIKRLEAQLEGERRAVERLTSGFEKAVR